MTYIQFEELITKYYKKHTSTYVQETTMKYIKTTYPEKALDKLRIAILKTHRYSFGFPDVSAIETAHDKLSRNDSYNLKKKDVKAYSEDLHISDEEWEKGLPGMEALKNAVKIEEMKHDDDDSVIDKEKLKEIKNQLNKKDNNIKA